MLLLWLMLAHAADPEIVREQTNAVLVRARAAFDDLEYRLAMELALEAMELAGPLQKHDPVRLNAQLRLADAQYGLARYEDAQKTLQAVVNATERQKTADDVFALIEAASNLGSVRHALGDLNDAREWHETAWQLLQHHQVFTPIRFTVARQFSYTAQAQSDYTTARTLTEWVLTSLIAEVGQDHPLTAEAQIDQVHLLSNLGENTVAWELVTAAQTTYASTRPGSIELATADRMMAEVAIDRLELGTASEAFRRSWDLHVELFGEHDPRLELVLVTRANLRQAQGRSAEAITDRLQILKWALDRLGTTHPEVGLKRAALGQLYRDTSQLELAEQEVSRSVTILTDALGPTDPTVAGVRTELAHVWLAQGRYHDAITEFAAALQVLDASASHALEATRARSLMANAQQQAGETETALETHQQARAQAGLLGIPALTADIDNAYAVLLVEMGRVELAEQLLRGSLATIEGQQGPKSQVATVLFNLAFTLNNDDRPHEARPLMERALQLQREAYGPEHVAQAHALSGLAVILSRIGDFVRARALEEQVLSLRERALGPDHPLVAVSLDLLIGYVQDPAEQEALARRSLAIRQAHDPSSMADSLESLAVALAQQQRSAEALVLVDQALALNTKNPSIDGRFLLGLRVRRARLLAHLGRMDEALTEVVALRTHPAMPNSGPLRRHIDFDVGRFAFHSGQVERGQRELAQSLNRLESEMLSAFQRLSARERLNLAATYRAHLGAYLEAVRDADPVSAYAAVLRWKGVATRSLAVEHPAILAEADPTTYARWRAVGQRMSTLALTPSLEGATELSALTLEKGELRQKLSATAAATTPQFEQIDPVGVAKSIPKGALLVDYIRHSMGPPGKTYEIYTAFVLRKGTIFAVPLGEANTIDAAISKHRELLASRAPTARSDRAGIALRKLIWDPVVGQVEEETSAFIVPDSHLATAAFAALPVDDGYLVDRFTLRFLDAAIDIKPRASKHKGGAVVVGGIDYGSGDDAVADAETRSACATSFSRLPATQREAQRVGALLGKDTVVLTGATASQEGITAAITDVSILHLATHGFFAAGACRRRLTTSASRDLFRMNPMLLSGVALAGANDDRAAIWTAEEIATLPLINLDLVVLSACETGLGEIMDGEGVRGLRRAFALSGARATVMSLWPVEDEPTLALMTRFYERLLADPQRNEAKALREAQRWLRDSNLKEHGTARPQTWAGFVVAGSPRASP